MDFQLVGNFVLWAIATIGLLGAAAGFLRGSADKGTIASLENAYSGLQKEMEARDLEHARQVHERDQKIQAQDEKIAHQAQQIVGLGRQIAALRDVVTSAAEIAALQTTLDRHHDEAREHWSEAEQMLQRILGEVAA